MTKNQIALIQTREAERAARAKEDLERRSQNIGAGTSVAGSLFRGLASTLLGNATKKVAPITHATYNTVKHYWNKDRKPRRDEGGTE